MNWAYSMGTLFRYFFANFCAFAEQWLETVVVWPAYLDVSSRILGIFVNRLDGRTHAVLTTFFSVFFCIPRLCNRFSRQPRRTDFFIRANDHIF